MRRRLLLACCSMVLLMTAGAQNPAPSSPGADAEIRTLLQQQVSAWNRHDLPAFMAGYWNSPDLTFFSGASETKGWEPTLERYRQKYQSKGGEMGNLQMSDIEVVALGSEAAFVRGRWQLAMSDGNQPHGVYTLVLRRLPAGWRIVHDHTSGEQ